MPGSVRRAGSDAGFTLVELLVSIVILGTIAAPLAAILIGYFKNSATTAARMSESHDAQIAAAYFAQDVQALGVRDYTDPTKLDKPLVKSVETGVTATGGTYPCGSSTTPDPVVRFAWDDWDGVPSDPTAKPVQVRVAYVVENRTELHRLVCHGSAAVVSDAVIAHNVVTPVAPPVCTDVNGTVIKDASGLSSCKEGGLKVPSNVSVMLVIQDPEHGSGAPYSITLTGQRRQS